VAISDRDHFTGEAGEVGIAEAKVGQEVAAAPSMGRPRAAQRSATASGQPAAALLARRYPGHVAVVGVPPAPTLSIQERIARLIRRQGGRGDALIEVLHQVQELEGHLSPASLRQVARGLGLPLSRVQGVASFYHLFLLEPPTPHRCAVCLGTACFVKGAADLARALERHLGVRLDDAAGDGSWALQHVSCLGACGQAPVLVVDGAMQTLLPVDDPEALYERFAAAGLPEPAASAAADPW
jgi:NADH:ubiquinone oxidoreductase subunit E